VLPPEVKIHDSLKIKNQCGDYLVAGVPLQNGELPDVSCSIVDSGVVLEGLFQYGSTSYQQTVTFTVPGLQNPRLVGQPTQSFQVYIFEDTAMQLEVYAKTTGISVAMVEPNPFSRIVVTPESSVNKAHTTYRFKVEGNLVTREGDLLVVDFPAQVSVPSVVKCLSEASKTLSCSVNNKNQVRLILDAATAQRPAVGGLAPQRFEFSISQVVNSGTTAPSDPFSFTLKSPDGFLIAQNSSLGRVATLMPFQLPVSAFLAAPLDYRIGEITNYDIKYFPATYVAGMLIELKLPSQLHLVNIYSIECISMSRNVAATVTCKYDSLRDAIIVAKALTTIEYDIGEGVVFRVGKIRNPLKMLKTDSFRVTTFTEDGYLVDERTQDLSISFDCLKPCRTCLDHSNVVCETCFEDSDSMLLHKGKCINQCPTKFFPTQNLTAFTCEPCLWPKVIDGSVCREPDSQSAVYFFPFAIVAALWLLFAIIFSSVKRQIYFPALAIPGVLLVSLLLALYEVVDLYPTRRAAEFTKMTLITTFGIPLCVQIGFALILFCKLANDVAFRRTLRLYKASTTALIILSLLLNFRLFKLGYCNWSARLNIESLRDRDGRKGLRPWLLNLVLSLLMVPCDLASCGIAVSLLVWADADTRLK